jgi:hypothetical protein
MIGQLAKNRPRFRSAYEILGLGVYDLIEKGFSIKS